MIDSSTLSDPVLFSILYGLLEGKYAVAEHVIFLSSTLNGERVSRLTDGDCSLNVSEISTLSLSLDKTISDLDHVMTVSICSSVIV